MTRGEGRAREERSTVVALAADVGLYLATDGPLGGIPIFSIANAGRRALAAGREERREAQEAFTELFNEEMELARQQGEGLSHDEEVYVWNREAARLRRRGMPLPRNMPYPG